MTSNTRIMGIEFAPLNVPIERRLQTLAALMQNFLVFLGGIVGYAVIAYMFCYTRFYWLALAYVCFIVGERGVSSRGSYFTKWVRQWQWWTYARDYFPAKLVKTAELDTSRNYLLCVFPHGVLSTGVFINFGTEANKVSDLFPGIRTHIASLALNLRMPFVREIFLRLGVCSSSQESLNYLLNKGHGTGRSVVLVVGGSAESLQSKPGTYRITLKNRKGFVKVALRNGASLVPVITFGETDLFSPWLDNTKGTWVRRYQEAFRRVTGIAPLFMSGRGLFQYSFGIIPFRKPITTVVGEPMEAEHILEPTQEHIDDLHTMFQEKLTALFEEHKHKYLKNSENIFLVIE